MTGKQRSYLKKLAHGMVPSFQIGKDGLTEGILNELDTQLEYKELIKISVLDNNPEDFDDLVSQILDETRSEFVQKIGSKLVIYRESKDHKKIVLP